MTTPVDSKGAVVGAVLAAGQGTRLRPLSEDVPKPLVPWLDGPMINVARRTLQSAGCDPIGFNACYAADTFTSWAEGEDIDTSLISYENKLLGTGGGVTRLVRHLGYADDDDAIIVSWNGDVIANPDVRPLIADVQDGAVASLLLRERMHDERGIEATTVGHKVHTLPNHEGEHQSSDVPEAGRDWFGFTGIMAMRASALRDSPADTELCSFRDILGPRLAEGADIRFRYYDGFYSDLGTAERYFWSAVAALQQDFLGYVSSGMYTKLAHPQGTLWAHRTAEVPVDVVVIGDVVCGRGTRVAPGLTLENSVLLDTNVKSDIRSAICIQSRRISVDVEASMLSYASDAR